MEDVNSLLNSGTLPNLWASDELESIVTSMRPVLKEKGILDNRDMCLQQFLQRSRESAHNSLPLTRWRRISSEAEKFPSLVNCTTIDWFSECRRGVALCGE